jgi:hypothetical protein
MSMRDNAWNMSQELRCAKVIDFLTVCLSHLIIQSTTMCQCDPLGTSIHKKVLHKNAACERPLLPLSPFPKSM